MRKLRWISWLLIVATVLSLCPLSAMAVDIYVEEKSEVDRYTVLVLDTSGKQEFSVDGVRIYIADPAIDQVKSACGKFLSALETADGTNHVAIVTYSGSASIKQSFTDDITALKKCVDGITVDGVKTDIASGLTMANSLLNNISDGDNVRKNVVLFTTGMTNCGFYYSFLDTGPFTKESAGGSWVNEDGNPLYHYANHAVTVANILKKQASVYVIQTSQSMINMPEQGLDIATLFRRTASKIATSDRYFYSNSDSVDLQFTIGEVAEDLKSSDSPKAILFNYDGGTETCFFSENYFYGSANEFSSYRATLSMALAWSAFGVKTTGNDGQETSSRVDVSGTGSADSQYRNSNCNARQLMTDIGMTDIVSYGYDTKPTTDSIAAIIGSMPITTPEDETFTLIALAIRGGGYEQEWASNFTLGETGLHSGFQKARNQVFAYLESYLEEQEITGHVKFWITGYSRAAATANLVAGSMDNGVETGVLVSEEITYDKSDIYAYCFEPPAGAVQTNGHALDSSFYGNIYNIVNSSDPVIYVAPAKLGFGRYGIDYYLPCAASEAKGYELHRKKCWKSTTGFPIPAHIRSIRSRCRKLKLGF